jgi:endonuclease/exonuclease/phosphatase family metal-dependent hydrolase
MCPTRKILFIAAALLWPTLMQGQVLMSGGTYSQNFDSLANGGTGNTWTENVTLPGWYASKSVAPNDVASYNAGTGSSTAGALYSFGSSGSTERALGSLASGTPGDFAYGVCFTNDTGSDRTNIVISYTGEQWRVANTNVQKLAFSFQVGNLLTNADAPNTQTWRPFSALDFSSPNTNATQALNGNDPTNQVVFTNIVLSGVVIPAGQELFLRWFDPDDSGSDDGLGLDNLTVSFGQAVTNTPPPATNTAFSMVTYNLKGNGASDWSTNAAQVQAIARELIYLNPDIIAFNEIPNSQYWEMTNWVIAFFPAYTIVVSHGTDGFIRSGVGSRFPITRWTNYLDGASLTNFGYNGTFTRDLLEAQISIPGFSQPLHVFVTHLKSGTSSSDDAARRAAEASAISNYFVTGFLTTNALQPYLLAGDMNEDIAFPATGSQQPIQRLTNNTGLRLTTPLNPFTLSPLTHSIQSAGGLDRRYDYILPCTLLFSNIQSSQVFRTDLLTNFPSPAVSDFVTSKQVSITLQGRGAGPGEGSP